MNRTIAIVLVSILVVGLFADGASADPASDFEALFGAEAKKAAATRIKSDDVALAAKFLTAAAGAPDSPEFQVLLYEKAYEFGMKSKGGYPHAIAAVRRLAAADPKRQDECEKKLLAVHDLAYRTARGKDRVAAGQMLSGYLLSLADARAASGNTSEALTIYRRAHVVAKSIRSKNAKIIVEKINAVVTRQHLDRRIAALQKVLKDKPDDSRTAKQLLMMILIERNDPQAAMELLPAADADEATRTFITLATKTWEDLPEDTYIDLGDWYRQLSKRTSGIARLRILTRARAYYQTYLTLRGKADASALRATMPMKALDKELATAGRIDCGYRPPPKGVTRALAQWTRKRDALPVKERMGALLKKLAEVNGGSAVKAKGFTIRQDRIVSIKFDDDKNIASIGPLYRMKLTELSLRATTVEGLQPLEGMKLTKLNIRTCPKLRSLEGLQGMEITSLDLYGNRLIDDLTPLGGLPLTSLLIRGLPVKTLKGLEGMPLDTLGVYDCAKLESIEALAGAPLRKLNIANCWRIKNLKPLRGLPLTNLNTNTLPPGQFALLKGMPLKVLWISGCKIKNLSALRGMKLTVLSLQNCKTIESIRGIEKMPLEKLYLQGTKFATQQVADGLKKKIPTLKKVQIK
ncbi:MAG: hypothetical protein QGH60_23635 [Phycisphaerae bacterium]|jgi:tetratricopeptide (TPR) repeat protein|nr:hypothetical protein [Phycisphaerae bacterium]